MPPQSELCCTYCDWKVLSWLTEEELKEFEIKCPKCGCPILDLKPVKNA